MKKRKKNLLKFLKKNFSLLLTILLILILFAYSYFNKGIAYSLLNSNIEQINTFINSFGIFAFLIFVFLVVLEVVLAPIPPLALYIIAGSLFGGLLGGILTLIGNLIGAFICFKIARKLGENTINKTINKKLKKKFDKFFNKYGTLAIFILRINPLTTSDLVSYLAGFTKIKTLRFLIATGLGLVPLIFIQTFLGDIIITKNPIFSILIILFSLIYLLIFIYLIYKSITESFFKK